MSRRIISQMFLRLIEMMIDESEWGMIAEKASYKGKNYRIEVDIKEIK